jgi:hypothetical protein
MRKICVTKPDWGGTGQPSMFPFGLFRFRNCCRAATLIALACVWPGIAHAGDLEDCNSGVPEKVETGCTAIVNNAARTSDAGVKAFVNRSRMYANRSKFDLALADAEAALQLDASPSPPCSFEVTPTRERATLIRR